MERARRMTRSLPDPEKRLRWAAGVLHVSSTWFGLGAVTAALGVALGAFGAHGLKTRVSPEMLVVFETAVRYHMIHALGLLAVGWAADRWPVSWVQVSGVLMLAGIGIIGLLTANIASLFLFTGPDPETADEEATADRDTGAPSDAEDRLVEINDKLDEVLRRLDRVEKAGAQGDGPTHSR